MKMHSGPAWKNKETLFTQTLFNKRVGLHGFGAIAQELIPLLAPFKCHVSAYSPSVPDEVFERLNVTRSNSLESLFSENQVVIELAANTPRNHHIVNEKILRSLPEHAVFINTGRGAVVDEIALEKIAKEGQHHFGLDVYEVEPLPENSGLRSLGNVFLLPHIGGPTTDARRDAGAFAIENIGTYLDGQEVLSNITEEIYARST